MGLKLGNTTIGSLYLGSTRITEAWLGSNLIYWYTQPVYQYPYLLMEFESGYTPTTNLLFSPYRDYCRWTQVSSSPNVWNLEIHNWIVPQPTSNWGVDFLFCANVSSYAGSLTMPCKLVGSGNFDVELNGAYCLSMDRMFTNCTGLTLITPIQCPTVQNVGGMFQGCTNVEEGALDQYNWFDTYATNINNHSGTFTDCGSNTQTGTDELDQIPTGWGGNMVPAASTISGTRVKIYSNYDAWNLGSPPFSSIRGMSLFTAVSVSSYAGVSMNRSRIRAINSLGTASGNALYFYPCFAQFNGTGSSARITWCYTTTGYNGMLTSTQGNTDMPGTLDYSTYGTFENEYGTYDSPGATSSVYFIFLVTNVPIAQWGGLSDAYGVLYNSNFRNTDFKYFF